MTNDPVRPMTGPYVVSPGDPPPSRATREARARAHVDAELAKLAERRQAETAAESWVRTTADRIGARIDRWIGERR